jgi:CheY-like chemotaxis protein
MSGSCRDPSAAPRSLSDGADHECADVVAEAQETCLCANVRLLLVDDSPLVRKLVLSQLLRDRAGAPHGAEGPEAPAGALTVIEASSVAEARACTETEGAVPAAASVPFVAPSIFDAALLDLELGDGTGLDVAAHLHVVAPHCRVAFFSSATTQALLRPARRFGPVFEKPGQLAEAVRWLRETASGAVSHQESSVKTS